MIKDDGWTNEMIKAIQKKCDAYEIWYNVVVNDGFR